MSDGGKGSSPRPYGVDKKTFDNNWDRIFNNKNTPKNTSSKDKELDKFSVKEDNKS